MSSQLYVHGWEGLCGGTLLQLKLKELLRSLRVWSDELLCLPRCPRVVYSQGCLVPFCRSLWGQRGCTWLLVFSSTGVTPVCFSGAWACVDCTERPRLVGLLSAYFSSALRMRVLKEAWCLCFPILCCRKEQFFLLKGPDSSTSPGLPSTLKNGTCSAH